MVHVFIVASKGIPAKYGGFETFVENLTARRMNREIQYHVSCMGGEETAFTYNDADCFRVKVPFPGALGRVLHVSRVLYKVESWSKAHPGKKVIVYILGCRIGLLFGRHARALRRLGVRIYCNPDGFEWKRAKWNAVAKRFLHYCEKCLIADSEVVVCDSKTIEKYVLEAYPAKRGATAYIAYGADVDQSGDSADYQSWCDALGLREDSYYLVVGRFVPENNYESIIREFMLSGTKRDLVIVTDVRRGKYYETLRVKTGFDKDQRIKFVGTVYNARLLAAIRRNAYAYLHGHSVGGTNPSLLEALANTRVNLLYDVAFNREVAQDSALYWSLEEGNLASLIDEADSLSDQQIAALDEASTDRIRSTFRWEKICGEYERLWIGQGATAGF